MSWGIWDVRRSEKKCPKCGAAMLEVTVGWAKNNSGELRIYYVCENNHALSLLAKMVGEKLSIDEYLKPRKPVVKLDYAELLSFLKKRGDS